MCINDISTGSSSSLCDSSVERGIISSSSGTVLVDTSLPVDPVCIRCGYQDQLYTDSAIVTYYYNGAVIVNDTIGSVWVTDEGLIIQDPAVYFDHIICSFVPINESMARSNEIDIIFFGRILIIMYNILYRCVIMIFKVIVMQNQSMI